MATQDILNKDEGDEKKHFKGLKYLKYFDLRNRM